MLRFLLCSLLLTTCYYLSWVNKSQPKNHPSLVLASYIRTKADDYLVDFFWLSLNNCSLLTTTNNTLPHAWIGRSLFWKIIFSQAYFENLKEKKLTAQIFASSESNRSLTMTNPNSQIMISYKKSLCHRYVKAQLPS